MPWPTRVSEYRGTEPLRAVVSGLGAVRERLAAHLAAQNVTRPMIVCGENVSRSPVLELVQNALGDVWSAPVFDGSRPHTPVETIAAGAAAARAADADALISVGGSSTVDCTRGIAVLLAKGLDDVSELEPAEYGKLGQAAAAPDAGAAPPTPVLCVTTTLSFGEFLPFWGARHADVARKRPYLEDGHVSRTVFLDGEVASHTPGSVWCETGVKALDDALMSYCRATGSEPFADPVLVSAIGALGTLLPRSRADDQLVGRQHVLTAVWMTKFGWPRLSGAAGGGWFSTSARHALGAVLEVPHGVGSCVALLPGLRYHAVDTAERQTSLKRAVSWGHNVTYASLYEAVAALLARLQVPTHLRDLGFDSGLEGSRRARLDDVVAAMVDEAPWLGAPDQLRTACQEML